MALELVASERESGQSAADSPDSTSGDALRRLVQGALAWLAEHQNDDGGWGDTEKSLSNISTTMLAHATFRTAGDGTTYAGTVSAAKRYIDQAGGVGALLKRYGKDKTFSIPILTHCALAGVVDWKAVHPLPFELACLPQRFYKTVRLPVVSYALPALIAIGQVRFDRLKPRNPLLRLIRSAARNRSLRKLAAIQPENGGFLEATPLTSFVTMSLAGMGLSNHPVAQRGVEFLVQSVRDDGSWPIDTNLATWVTTLSVNALGDDLPQDDREPIRNWILGQQYQSLHPYTGADPGGWSWTDLPGGVPDADDTPGAIRALLTLRSRDAAAEFPLAERQQMTQGIEWLLGLQNRDGGWPTFCRGWGALPFDRSGSDISAHVVRAMIHWGQHPAFVEQSDLIRRTRRAVQQAFDYLQKSQRNDGSWLPLWFGNQFATDDENPTYGTARVLAAYHDADRLVGEPARKAASWLTTVQNGDGGWGGAGGVASSVEETALAVEALIAVIPESEAVGRGLEWLMDRVDDESFAEPTPIGFYFAKLWYFERLYPQIFMVGALGAARRHFASTAPDGRPRSRPKTMRQPAFGS